MSDHERGPRPPPSDPFAFHPRAPVRSGPAPVTLIASAVVLFAALGAVYFVYQGGLRHRGEPPASVGAPVGEIKTPAPPASGDAPTGLVVDRSDEAANAAAPTFAPPPEAPSPLPAATARAAPALRPAKPPPETSPQAAPAQQASAPAQTASAPAQPASAPATRPMTIGSLTDAAMKDRSRAVPQAAPAKPAAPAIAAAPAGGALVQIGAFSSAALAAKGWDDVARLQAAGMDGRGRQVEAVQRGSETFYRAYVTGFDSRSDAEAFCGRLKAAGHACFVK